MNEPLTQEEQTREAYRDQLAAWAHAMATGKIDVLSDGIAPEFTLDHVAWFVDGNIEKRLQVVLRFLEFVAPAFNDFEKLVEGYVMEYPFAAMDSPTGDAERCLRWIEQTQSLTPEQRDYVACQRARHAVEAAGGRMRLAHARFQEIASLAPRLAEELETNSGLQIHLNPIHTWARFETSALLEDGDQVPAEVLFFAVGGSVSTAVLSEEARELVKELDAGGPWTLDTWAGLSSHANRQGLVQFCRDLAQMGLVAFG